MISQTNALISTTQKYLELYDITNDVIVLQDGSVSMVMHSTAINFDLYSEEEQDAAIYAYAALLNSLSFPIEIVIRSQKKDVTSYLDLLKTAEVKAYSPVNKTNIRQYRQFVEELVQERNVLEKKFYIVITYTALEAGIITGSSFFPGLSKKNTKPLDKNSILERALTNLEPRKEHLIHQFARIGLFLQQLKTQELIQLFYTIYNPDTSKGIKISTTEEYATPLVQADVQPLEVLQAKAVQTPLTPLGNEAPISPERQKPEPVPPVQVQTAPADIPNIVLPPTQVESMQPTQPPEEPTFSPVMTNDTEQSHSDLVPPTPPEQLNINDQAAQIPPGQTEQAPVQSQ